MKKQNSWRRHEVTEERNTETRYEIRYLEKKQMKKRRKIEESEAARKETEQIQKIWKYRRQNRATGDEIEQLENT